MAALGTITVIDRPPVLPARLSLADYVVRQIRVIFKQLWPDHGQRFPQ